MTGQPHPEPQPQKKKVLVVDPGKEVAETVSTVLRAWSVTSVRDNEEALAAVEQSYFSLVVTDDETTGREDVELLRKIRKMWPHTRVIILTDASTPQDVIAAIRGRAFSYFSKPFSMSSFAQMLRLATDSPAWDEGIELISGTPSWVRLTARCDLGTADRLSQFIHEVVDLPDNERERVAVAFREILLNAMEHGAKFDPNEVVEISYVSARQMVLCRVKDPGEGFSLTENPRTAGSNPPDDPFRHIRHREEEGIRAGGYGVMLAKNLVDELIYGEKGNDVLLIKYLDEKERSAEPAPPPPADA